MRTILSNPSLVRTPVCFATPVFQGADWDAERNGSLFPPVPTLLATRLQLELLLSDRSVDLRAAAGIILNDLGATLEIFRRAGEESGAGPNGESIASRLEDCLAILGTEAWMDAVCANAVERVAGSSRKLSELTSFWEHGRLLAYACWLVAERTEGICPEEAYLVGLLHEAGRLPELLGWELPSHCSTELCWTGQQIALLAAHWQLPEYLKTVIAAPASTLRWDTLLRTAHTWSHGGELLLSQTA